MEIAQLQPNVYICRYVICAYIYKANACYNVYALNYVYSNKLDQLLVGMYLSQKFTAFK